MSLQYQILLIVAITGYIIGSIPFGYIFTKIFAKKDLREVGSGTTGMSNTLRTAGFFPALLTLILDVAKPVIAGFIAWEIIGETLGNLSSLVWMTGRLDELKTTLIALTGVFAIIGHCYSPFLKFKGGKGLASLIGLMTFVNPATALAGFGVCLIILNITHLMSLATLTMILLYPIFMHFFETEFFETMIYIIAFAIAFVILMHGKSIKRLLTGTEHKTYIFKKNKS